MTTLADVEKLETVVDGHLKRVESIKQRVAGKFTEPLNDRERLAITVAQVSLSATENSYSLQKLILELLRHEVRRRQLVEDRYDALKRARAQDKQREPIDAATLFQDTDLVLMRQRPDGPVHAESLEQLQEWWTDLLRKAREEEEYRDRNR